MILRIAKLEFHVVTGNSNLVSIQHQNVNTLNRAQNPFTVRTAKLSHLPRISRLQRQTPEIQVFGKALYQSIPLGKTGTSRKNRLKPITLVLGKSLQGLNCIPVFLDKGRTDPHLRRNVLNNVGIRGHADI